jgi:SAM-dependent methyltransferase
VGVGHVSPGKAGAARGSGVTTQSPGVRPGRPPSNGSWARRLNQLLILAGVEPLRLLHTARTLPLYLRNYREYRRLQRGPTLPDFPVTRHVPMFHDRTASAGRRGAYFHQDLLVARRILERRPRRHVDVGSRIDGFVAHVALFREIEVLDIRPMAERIPNIVFRQVDFMREDQPLVDYCDSVSCLHALEHFGLGRYGDPIDPAGHLKGFRNLHRILQTGGVCYLSVPMGPQRTEFDSQRVFSLDYLLRMVTGDFRLERFSYVDDAGALHEDVALTPELVATDGGCTLGCAILELVRVP